MLIDYLPVLIVFFIAVVFAGGGLIVTHLLGPKEKSIVKDTVYESGVDPIGDARIRFSIKFFIIALLFIIFDIEIVFLFPWAVVFKDFLQAGNQIFYEMIIFIGILLFGYIYVVRKGVLRWE